MFFVLSWYPVLSWPPYTPGLAWKSFEMCLQTFFSIFRCRSFWVVLLIQQQRFFPNLTLLHKHVIPAFWAFPFVQACHGARLKASCRQKKEGKLQNIWSQMLSRSYFFIEQQKPFFPAWAPTSPGILQPPASLCVHYFVLILEHKALRLGDSGSSLLEHLFSRSSFYECCGHTKSYTHVPCAGFSSTKISDREWGEQGVNVGPAAHLLLGQVNLLMLKY